MLTEFSLHGVPDLVHLVLVSVTVMPLEGAIVDHCTRCSSPLRNSTASEASILSMVVAGSDGSSAEQEYVGVATMVVVGPQSVNVHVGLPDQSSLQPAQVNCPLAEEEFETKGAEMLVISSGVEPT